ncbi:MAG: tetratricopeptide repeat protein [Aureliella sp.]
MNANQSLLIAAGFIIQAFVISPLGYGQDPEMDGGCPGTLGRPSEAVISPAPYTLRFEDFADEIPEFDSIPLPLSRPIEDQIDLPAAVAKYDELAKQRPKHWPTKLLLGKLLLRKAKQDDHLPSYLEAHDTLEDACKLAPNSTAAQIAFGQCCLAVHEFQTAWDIAEHISKRSPQAADTALVLALKFDAALELGDLVNAQSTADRLLRIEPSPPVKARVARLAELQGNPEVSIRLLRESAKELADSTDDVASIAWYRWRIGSIMLDAGRTQDAFTEFVSALELDPSHSESRVGLAHVYFAQNQIELAKQELVEASKSEAPTIVALLGDLLAHQGRTAEAESLWVKARAIMAEEAEYAQVAHSREVAIFLADHQRELELATNLANLNLEQRRDATAWDCRAWVAFRSGELEIADTAMEKALSASAPQPLTLFHAALIANAGGKRQVASEYVAQIRDINPAFSITHATAFAELCRDLQATH